MDFAEPTRRHLRHHAGRPHLAEGRGACPAGNIVRRDRIVAAIDRKRAAGMRPAEAVADYLRDAAFTTLNRFVALKMLEARDLVQECVSRGDASAGYQRILRHGTRCPFPGRTRLSPLPRKPLRRALDRSEGSLRPARPCFGALARADQTFEALLRVLNAPDLPTVWAADETIGWVYQFFNGADERKKMRDESPAPRNSRELAVRNQFFTPRYVVQFLVDNTLGRHLAPRCTAANALAERATISCARPTSLSAHASKRPARPKDPRSRLRLGSFPSLCFDLLLTIYEEAWALDGGMPPSELTGRTLHDDYPDLSRLRCAAPSLIVEHNLIRRRHRSALRPDRRARAVAACPTCISGHGHSRRCPSGPQTNAHSGC